MESHTTFVALGSTFIINAEYEYVKEIGQGTYGCVVAVRHKDLGQACAIKKITNISTKRVLTRQCLREIKFLRHFRGHTNIIRLYDMDIVFQPNGGFDEVYLYEELMEADLHAIIRSGQPLTDDHFQALIYQTLCGLKYIHSANVLHRDIKPGNLLVNADCELRICDFGLARGYTPGSGKQGPMTGYVALRWYRAPETLFSFANYTPAIDVWSVGCVLAELLGGRPLFKGRDYSDQLNLILHYLGTPSEDTLGRILSPLVQEYIRSLPVTSPVPFETLFPNANPLALELISQILHFDPAQRISCEQALNHPYLQVWHDPENEPDCKTKFDSSFEEEDSMPVMKELIVKEVNTFRKEVRAQAKAAEQINREDIPPTPSQGGTINAPGDASDATSSDTIPAHDPPTPVADSSSTQREIINTEIPVATSTKNDNIVPRGVDATTPHPQPSIPSVTDPRGSTLHIEYSSLGIAGVQVVPNDSIQVERATSGADSPAVVVSGQSDGNSFLEFAVPNTLQNDLTLQITRNGHDPVASGGFADIYRGRLQDNGGSAKVAIKAIKMYSSEGDDFSKKYKRLRREIKVWLDLRHVNVLPLLGTTMGFGRFPAMVCPWAENGTLTSYLEDKHDSLSVVEILRLLHNVASGLQYLHSCSVVHGDLSGSNVLIHENGRACIADFGLSMLLTELEASTFATSFHARGTLRWTAPELLDLEIPDEEESPHSGPTMQSDVYSFGSIMLQILSGKVPYHYYTREVQVIHAVSRGMTPKRPSTSLVTERRWTFIESCWSTGDCARSRPSGEEVVAFTLEELELPPHTYI